MVLGLQSRLDGVTPREDHTASGRDRDATRVGARGQQRGRDPSCASRAGSGSRLPPCQQVEETPAVSQKLSHALLQGGASCRTSPFTRGDSESARKRLHGASCRAEGRLGAGEPGGAQRGGRAAGRPGPSLRETLCAEGPAPFQRRGEAGGSRKDALFEARPLSATLVPPKQPHCGPGARETQRGHSAEALGAGGARRGGTQDGFRRARAVNRARKLPAGSPGDAPTTRARDTRSHVPRQRRLETGHTRHGWKRESAAWLWTSAQQTSWDHGVTLGLLTARSRLCSRPLAHVGCEGKSSTVGEGALRCPPRR